MISTNIKSINQNIKTICDRIGRDASEITLIGVTKYTEVDLIEQAIDAGIKDIAESRVQDAEQKFLQIKNISQVTKHMIGNLQSNKVKLAVQLFDTIQSVDRLKIAREIDKQAADQRKKMNIFLQVNTSGEEQKSGFSTDLLRKEIDDILQLKNICIQGLMTMAPLTDDKTWIHQTFRDVRLLRDELVQKHPQLNLKYLSMGMTQDYPIALEEGANMLRIGSAIFQK